MNTITFGKDRYHQQQDMSQWCHENIGHGGWSYGSLRSWEGLNGKIWLVYGMFGNTTFCFKNEKDLLWFTMRWS